MRRQQENSPCAPPPLVSALSLDITTHSPPPARWLTAEGNAWKRKHCCAQRRVSTCHVSVTLFLESARDNSEKKVQIAPLIERPRGPPAVHLDSVDKQQCPLGVANRSRRQFNLYRFHSLKSTITISEGVMICGRTEEKLPFTLVISQKATDRLQIGKRDGWMDG